LSSLAALTATDEFDLPSLGEKKKMALFAVIPDNDTFDQHPLYPVISAVVLSGGL